MKQELLYVWLAGQPAGRLLRSQGRIGFEYDAAWQRDDQAVPLSVSMPLTQSRHGHAVVEPFLWGLLPDNSSILDAWARRFQVSAGHPFGLLRSVGEDCPGAVQLLSEQRHAQLARARDNRPPVGEVVWLSDTEIEARLRELRQNVALWRTAGDNGQFSLAGAQPKTALCFDGARWGIPSGRTPTTHILKPGIPGLDGSAENEHFCLELARAVGLPTARSEGRRFGAELAIVVTRYDRLGVGPAALRVHQEDFCQALGVHPSRKYQNEGGPSARQMVDLLRNHSTDSVADIRSFVQALVFNWVIAGTDAHAKNYSLLIGRGGRARLAPLYDVASALPYADMQLQKLKLAMKIGSTYRLRDVQRDRWQQLGKELGLDPRVVLSSARELAARVASQSEPVLAACLSAGLDHPLLLRLHLALTERANACVRLLGR